MHCSYYTCDCCKKTSKDTLEFNSVYLNKSFLSIPSTGYKKPYGSFDLCDECLGITRKEKEDNIVEPSTFQAIINFLKGKNA